jgi:C4-dicarboxylate-specific signal transduction histidine kinase
VVPIQATPGGGEHAGHAALMVMEDRTQTEQVQQLEIEVANLRLLTSMADRLVPEINNAIFGLSVHQQMYDERIKEAEFRKTLKVALDDGLRRVERLMRQMTVIYGNSNKEPKAVSLGKLLEEANKEARGYLSSNSAKLEVDAALRKATVFGTSETLKRAFAEILLNGYQANKEAPEVHVRPTPPPAGDGAKEIGIDFEDAGPGFTPETLKRGPEPFFTTSQSVGVGLGLSAAQKVVADHGGRLEIPADQQGKHGLVRVFLPTDKPKE